MPKYIPYSERVSLFCLKLLFTKAQVARRSTGLVDVLKEKVSLAARPESDRPFSLSKLLHN